MSTNGTIIKKHCSYFYINIGKSSSSVKDAPSPPPERNEMTKQSFVHT